MRKYRVLDLFAGAGGLSCGFEQTGKYEVVAFSENNPNAVKTYKENHKHVNEHFDDVRRINYQELISKVDVVIGGPPCQGFSNANRQRNHLVSTNNELVKEYIRAIKALRPEAFVMENVKMFSSSKHKFFHSEMYIDDFIELKKNGKTSVEVFHIDSLEAFEDDIAEAIQRRQSFSQYQISADSYSTLNILFRVQGDDIKLKSEILRKESDIKRVCEEMKEMRHRFPGDVYGSEMKRLFDIFLNAKNEVSSEFKLSLHQLVIAQRLFNKLEELVDHQIIIDDVDVEAREVKVFTKSVNVLDFVMNALQCDYSIGKGVLNAVKFGVPQYRERYILIGVSKEKIDVNELELPKGDVKRYFTVEDAIADLADLEPFKDVVQQKVLISRSPNKYRRKLYSSAEVYNHINTKTTETAQKRFEALAQGENFHNLAEDMKTTYTEPGRTQNSIYLRLDYKKPSNTVTNVRKSMWIHPIKDRALSIREAARLQSFPDNFIFKGHKDSQYQQVGNAVPPLLGEAIAGHLYRLLEEGAE